MEIEMLSRWTKSPRAVIILKRFLSLVSGTVLSVPIAVFWADMASSRVLFGDVRAMMDWVLRTERLCWFSCATASYMYCSCRPKGASLSRHCHWSQSWPRHDQHVDHFGRVVLQTNQPCTNQGWEAWNCHFANCICSMWLVIHRYYLETIPIWRPKRPIQPYEIACK